MNTKLREFEPELYDMVADSLDKHEIRNESSERIIIEDWLAKALITESLLNLIRAEAIEISGLTTETDDNGIVQFEPQFIQRVVNVFEDQTLNEEFSLDG
jgi:hypothetical protein